MENDQTLKIIESGETQEVELKRSFHSAQEFSKIMCALANTYGGVILIGVDSGKQVVGVEEDADVLQQKISAAAPGSDLRKSWKHLKKDRREPAG